MNRRDFMAAGAAAALWPLRAAGQQGRTPRVAMLTLSNPEPSWTFLKESFREAGYVDGKNLRLELRSADGKPEVLAQHAADLVSTKVDVIVTIQTPAARAAIQRTKEIPILIIAGAPVETGIVPNLNRPGGNVTGVSSTGREGAVKTLELMREVTPGLRRVAAAINTDDLGFGKPLLEHLELAAKLLSIEIVPFIVHAQEELDAAFPAMVKARAQAVVVQPSLPRDRAIGLALKHRVPIITSNASWAPAGAFMSYGYDQRDASRKVVAYAVRILNGARPGELPVQLPTHFELIINQKTARALGLTVPQSVLLRANKVIE